MKLHYFDVSFDGADPACARFVLFAEQVRPELERRTPEFAVMYHPVMGRPETSPSLLAGITILQMMEGKSDLEAVNACLYDLRWKLALGLPLDSGRLHASTLCVFRGRLAKNKRSRIAFDSVLETMRKTGYLRRHGACRIDSTHVLGCVERLSRLDCVRETLRLALEFLRSFGGTEAWQPWLERYANSQNERPRRKPSKVELERQMQQAGMDAKDILSRADKLGAVVSTAEPIALLRRVFSENFKIIQGGQVEQTDAQPSGAVHSPHDPEAQWSTKSALDKSGWVGYKTQLCETAPDKNRQKGEPTAAVITAVVTQPAITSDNGSITPVVEAHVRSGQAAPNTVHADAGYINAAELARSETEGFELCGPMPAPPHSGNGRFGTDAFEVDLANRRAVCPAGKASCHCAHITEQKLERTYYYFEWAKADCVACPLRNQCLSPKKQNQRRSIQVGELHEYAQARRKLCKSPEYRLHMRRRNAIEGTNSELKRGYGLGRARYRGLAKTDIQMHFIAAACNIRRWSARLCWLTRQAARKAA